MNYIELNNQVIIRDENGKYQLDKDKEALKSYLEDYIEPRMRKFNNLKERLDYLVKNDYYSKEIINMYDEYVIEVIYDFIRSKNFKFQSYKIGRASCRERV